MCKKEIARVALRSRCLFLFLSLPPALCIPAAREWLDRSTGMPRDAGLRCAAWILALDFLLSFCLLRILNLQLLVLVVVTKSLDLERQLWQTGCLI
jgi:hypothetical protein